MFSSNETLEIPLWKNASCGWMRDIFGLQCQFFFFFLACRKKGLQDMRDLKRI